MTVFTGSRYKKNNMAVKCLNAVICAYILLFQFTITLAQEERGYSNVDSCKKEFNGLLNINNHVYHINLFDIDQNSSSYGFIKEICYIDPAMYPGLKFPHAKNKNYYLSGYKDEKCHFSFKHKDSYVFDYFGFSLVIDGTTSRIYPALKHHSRLGGGDGYDLDVNVGSEIVELKSLNKNYLNIVPVKFINFPNGGVLLILRNFYDDYITLDVLVFGGYSLDSEEYARLYFPAQKSEISEILDFDIIPCVSNLHVSEYINIMAPKYALNLFYETPLNSPLTINNKSEIRLLFKNNDSQSIINLRFVVIKNNKNLNILNSIKLKLAANEKLLNCKDIIIIDGDLTCNY